LSADFCILEGINSKLGIKSDETHTTEEISDMEVYQFLAIKLSLKNKQTNKKTYKCISILNKEVSS